MIFGLVKLNFCNFFELSSLPIRCPAMPTNSTSSNVNLFVWNSLPDTVGFTSLAARKRSIRSLDFSEFSQCNDV